MLNLSVSPVVVSVIDGEQFKPGNNPQNILLISGIIHDAIYFQLIQLIFLSQVTLGDGSKHKLCTRQEAVTLEVDSSNLCQIS